MILAVTPSVATNINNLTISFKIQLASFNFWQKLYTSTYYLSFSYFKLKPISIP